MSVTSASSLRDRLVVEAVDLTSEVGWSAVTMARLAERAGVSRQTVYNEIGTRNVLAQAMVMHELQRFLARVDDAFEGHPELVVAIRSAAIGVLEMARDNPLIRAILGASHGPAEAGNADLLPLLTTDSTILISTATDVIRGHVTPYGLPLSDRELDAGIDLVVRLVLSHVTQPSGSPEHTADDIAWVAGRVLTR